MHVRELRNRVPQRVVKVTRRHVPAVNVRQHATGRDGGQGPGHGLDAVAEHDHHVCTGRLQEAGDA